MKAHPWHFPSKDIQNMEEINLLSYHSALNESLFRKGREYISPLCDKYGLTPVQVVFLAFFVENFDKREIRIADLAQYFLCTKTEIWGWLDELYGLENRRAIARKPPHEEFIYYMPLGILHRLVRGVGLPPLSQQEKMFQALMGKP